MTVFAKMRKHLRAYSTIKLGSFIAKRQTRVHSSQFRVRRWLPKNGGKKKCKMRYTIFAK